MLYRFVWVVDGNNLFTFKELKNALKYCKNTSPGENGIYYNMLQILSFVQQGKILDFYNYLWVNKKNRIHGVRK